MSYIPIEGFYSEAEKIERSVGDLFRSAFKSFIIPVEAPSHMSEHSHTGSAVTSQSVEVLEVNTAS